MRCEARTEREATLSDVAYIFGATVIVRCDQPWGHTGPHCRGHHYWRNDQDFVQPTLLQPPTIERAGAINVQ